jgi:hypothetical protein
MRGVEDPERMVARETFSEGGNQREKGPQPSKKGRIPGPAGEGKGAVVAISILVYKGRSVAIGRCKLT